MSLSIGIVGLPNVGKSTLFNALTRAQNAQSANYPFCTIEPNLAAVPVPDFRLQKLAELVNPQRIINATVEFVDIAGLVKGASRGEGLGNQFLSHIRDVDAICQVVRCFDSGDIVHVEGSVDPVRDIETINLELIFADTEVIEKRIPKIEKKAQCEPGSDAVKEYSILMRIKEMLDKGLPARMANLNDEEKEFVKNYSFLTMKPMLYVANVAEDEIATGNQYVEKVKEVAAKEGSKVVIISARIEEELCDLDDEDRQMFLEDLGVSTSGLDRLVKEAYDAYVNMYNAALADGMHLYVSTSYRNYNFQFQLKFLTIEFFQLNLLIHSILEVYQLYSH
jgi:GTP-binding protein YchF